MTSPRLPWPCAARRARCGSEGLRVGDVALELPDADAGRGSAPGRRGDLGSTCLAATPSASWSSSQQAADESPAAKGFSRGTLKSRLTGEAEPARNLKPKSSGAARCCCTHCSHHEWNQKLNSLTGLSPYDLLNRLGQACIPPPRQDCREPAAMEDDVWRTAHVLIKDTANALLFRSRGTRWTSCSPRDNLRWAPLAMRQKSQAGPLPEGSRLAPRASGLLIHRVTPP